MEQDYYDYNDYYQQEPDYNNYYFPNYYEQNYYEPNYEEQEPMQTSESFSNSYTTNTEQKSSDGNKPDNADQQSIDDLNFHMVIHRHGTT